LSKAFDRVHVICRAEDAVQYEKLDVPPNFITIPPEAKKSKLESLFVKIKDVFVTFSHPFRLANILFGELLYVLKQGKLNPHIFDMAARYLLAANHYALLLKRYLVQNPEIQIIYTYWFLHETMAAVFCKLFFNMRVICITRAHGCDIYECQQEINYQLYKKWMDKYVDFVFFVSKDGHDYYLNMLGEPSTDKYIISKLGIENKYILGDSNIVKASNQKMSIVSCSGMVSLKRINLIIEALSKIDDMQITWSHIGDGTERNKLENLAERLLKKKDNISYTFLGHLDNESVKEFLYGNYFDCFVSTTESEGLPVSMMEAISFGIPVIASDVGGVHEIVTKETGILIDPDNCVETLINALRNIAAMTSQDMEALRRSCRKYWEDNYRAETQYPLFVSTLSELINKQ